MSSFVNTKFILFKSAGLLFPGRRFITIFIFIINLFISAKCFGISYNWTGSTNYSWKNSSNWAPSGIPGSADNVTIGIAPINPLLDTSISIVNMTVNNGGALNLNQYFLNVTGTFIINSGGSIDIDNDTLSLTGIANFNGGTITNSGINGQVNIQSTTTTFGNAGGGPVISCDIIVNSATMTFRNTTFNNLAILEKNAGGNDASQGNNIFNGATTIRNTSSGGNLLLANTSPDTFNSNVTFENTQSNILYVAHNSAGTQFNGNIILNNTGTGSIRFCQGAAGTCVLADLKTVSIGTWGATGGNLYLKNFTQTGTTPQNINVNSGTGALYLQSGLIFNGDVNISFPQLYLNGCTFNGTATLEKNGATNDVGTGGNTFNKPAYITNSGTGYLMTANVTGDIFNDSLTLLNSGTSLIYIAYNDAAGTQLNGDVVVNSTSGAGIQFGSQAGTTILAGTKSISVGTNGFSSGTLLLKNFTQTGITPQILSLTGTAGLTFGPSSTINGSIVTTSSALLLNGCTFNGTASFLKTGATNDQGTGGNIFNDTLTASVTGNGYLQFNGAGDDMYNGNIILNNTGGGFRFGQNAGICNLAIDKTIGIGPGGFTSGSLYLKNFTQTGTAVQSLTLSGTAILYLQAGTTFNADVNFISPQLYLNGATFNGVSTLEKNGATNNASIGGNIFNQDVFITNSGMGYLRLSNATADLFNGDVTVSNTGSNLVYLAYNDAGGTQFNGNIILNETTGTGIQFGTGSGTATLANTKTISVGGLGFSSGTLLLKSFTQTGATSQIIAASGTAGITFGPASDFDGDITTNSASLMLNGCSFNGNAVFVKTGANNDVGTGGNTFNQSVTATDSGSGYLQFNGAGNDIYNGNIILNNIGGGFRFGQNAGTCTLASNQTISIGGSGFTSGALYLKNFIQLGTTAQSLTLTGTAILYLQTGSVFNADAGFAAPQIYLNGSTYNGITTIEKTGATNNAGTGGNIFNKPVTITNSGSGYLMTSNTIHDIYNDDVSIINSGASLIHMAFNDASGTPFNGNIFVSSISGTGIQFGAGTGTTILADTKTISVGGSGFTAGTLLLRNFTQVGTTPQTLSLTSLGGITFGPASTFGGNVSSTSSSILLNGCTFNGVSTFVKNGSSNDQSSGNNIFNGASSFANNGTGYILLARVTRDIFNNDVEFTNNNSSLIYVSYNDATGTQFNGNILVNSTAGTGIQFGNAAGTSILATGKTIGIGGTGFSVGVLLLRNFTQTGATAQALTLTNSAGITFGPASAFDGNVTTSSSALLLNGCTFNGILTFTKFGGTNDQSTGNNIFNSTASITNTGSGYLMLSQTTHDIFNNDVTFTNGNGNIIYPAYNDASGTQFNGNIILNNTGAGGIRFGQNTGTARLASGKTISIGVSGYANGDLYFKNFTQLGNTSQSIIINNFTTALYLQTGTVFNGDVNFNFPQIYLNGATFNGAATIEKNGATNNAGTGGNTFNGITKITNSGSGYFRLGNASGDIFNNSVTFKQIAAGALAPAFSGTNNFLKDVSTVGTNTSIAFSGGAGNVSFTGTVPQKINGDAANPPTISRLIISNSGNGLMLNVPVTVSTSATFVSGNIITTPANLLIFANNATVSGANDLSYVDGFVRKIGKQVFIFPTGGNNSYHPVAISAPALATDHFTAQYSYIDPNSAYDVTSHDPTIDHISRCEYWTLNRTNGVSNVTVTLSWNTASCGITNLADLIVCRWDVPSSMWKDHGNALTTGTTNGGTVLSSVTPTTFGVFTLGSTSSTNPLPIELVYFTAELKGKEVLINWKTASEINNDHFTVERSSDGKNFEVIGIVRGSGNSSIEHYYSLTDKSPLTGISFYRLSQADYDGMVHIYDPEKINFTPGITFSAGPNPFTSGIHIYSSIPVNSNYRIELLNVHGTTVYSKTASLPGDESENNLELPDLVSGIYILRITGEENIYLTMQIVKL